MSVSTVVTRGYGSFGSANKLPTLGYSIGAAVAAAKLLLERRKEAAK